MSTRDTKPLHPRKKPGQARSKALVDAILQAAAEMLKADGVDGLHVPALCERAGVSPGSFYQYFPHKEAVVYALLRQHAEGSAQRLVGLLASGVNTPTHTLIEAAVDGLIAEHQIDPTLHTVLGDVVDATAGPGPEQDLLSALQTGLVAIMKHRPDELRGRDPEVLSGLLVTTLESNIHRATRWDPDQLHHAEFRHGLVQMLVALVQ